MGAPSGVGKSIAVAKGHLKLSVGEARHLAALMAATCRPRSAQEAVDIEAWLKRLMGERR